MWMNDPNGLVFLNGKYHLFYQYFPDANIWGPMHWGHAESTDLIHWKHLPIALYPDKLGWIFSGSAVIDKENTAGFGKNAMVAIFTYHNDEIWKAGNKNTESQGIAYSLDEGKTWTKFEGNPVLNNSGEQDFRDPKVFWNDLIHEWTMVLAVHDHLQIYSSPNLKNWKLESSFKPENDIDVGTWECPDLIKLKVENSKEEKWVLIQNHDRKAPNGGSGTRYFVGDFDGKVFKNSQPSIWMDSGMDFYAGVTFGNVPNEKKLMISWMSNWFYAQKVPTEVWRSAMTLPRELSLKKVGNQYILKQKIAENFNKILTPLFSAKNVNLPFEKKVDLSQVEIRFDVKNPQNNFKIEFSNAKNEVFEIEIKGNQLTTNRSKSGLIDFDKTFAEKPQTLDLRNQKIINVQLILDQSSVEILLNNGEFSFTNLYFPTENYSIFKLNSNQKINIKNLKINKTNSIWKNK
ncbi:hypothetical protein GCM10010992_21310 [Cloacibacterium rupense]|uniref:Fructan beta-fructosidase n=2 Tax=Cloacibacterium rupense TaxID=517423 RepID=A0ABQ2NMK4_9FLAO|nr:hypothetical protein GCM10010992_21310 [Cloacibacterium rupense]